MYLVIVNWLIKLFLNSDASSCTGNNDTLSGAAPAKKKITSAYHCCVPRCTGDSRRNPELFFHKIPADENLKKIWIIKEMWENIFRYIRFFALFLVLLVNRHGYN